MIPPLLAMADVGKDEELTRKQSKLQHLVPRMGILWAQFSGTDGGKAEGQTKAMCVCMCNTYLYDTYMILICLYLCFCS